MTLIIKTKKVEKLSKKEIDFMNKQRVKEYGKESLIDFKKEDKGATFFFVIDNKKIMAFGMLKPVTVNYMNKKYNILGMGRGIVVKKLKGYGRALGVARLNYLKKNKKTGIAFTNISNIGFFEKLGFGIKKDFIKRFKYKNPKTGEIILDNNGVGVYYEGKDKLISKMLNTKSIATINVPFW